jgi:type II secretory pathway pseudopilin PulG
MKVSNIKKQSGAVLILLMVGLVLFVATVFLTGVDKTSQTLKKESKTQHALASAKELLINYALLSDQQVVAPAIGKGYLPCPDTSGDGVSNSCGDGGGDSQGWLPWKTLGNKVLIDGDRACLRYAVSSNYKATTTAVLTLGDPGSFRVRDQSGTTLINNAIAVVFSPGHQINNGSISQNRGALGVWCNSSNIPTQYLETFPLVGGDNNATLPNFVQAEKQDDFNDTLIWISP